MTKFKLTYLAGTGQTETKLVEAMDWISCLAQNQWGSFGPLIKIEVIGSSQMARDPFTGDLH